MALSIVGPIAQRGTAFRGIPSGETGILCTRFAVRYYPEVNQKFPNALDFTFVKNVSTSFNRDIMVEGVITGATGLMAFTLGTAVAFANAIAVFGPCFGSILLDEATVTFLNEGWKKLSMQASSTPLI